MIQDLKAEFLFLKSENQVKNYYYSKKRRLSGRADEGVEGEIDDDVHQYVPDYMDSEDGGYNVSMSSFSSDAMINLGIACVLKHNVLKQFFIVLKHFKTFF